MIPEFGEALPGVLYKDRPGGYGFLRNDRGEYAIIRTPAGLFLPGGGADPGESAEQALSREIFEEIGHSVIHAELVCQAVQYHWSEHYRQHFKKIGTFFRVRTTAPLTPSLEKDHELLWLPQALAVRELTQEFQRWAMDKA